MIENIADSWVWAIATKSSVFHQFYKHGDGRAVYSGGKIGRQNIVCKAPICNHGINRIVVLADISIRNSGKKNICSDQDWLTTYNWSATHTNKRCICLSPLRNIVIAYFVDFSKRHIISLSFCLRRKWRFSFINPVLQTNLFQASKLH